MRPPLIILAGGEGTRLRSVTGPQVPKPMVEVCGKPFLYWLIRHYRKQGFTDIIISTGYKSAVIEGYPWPEEVTFERDRTPGTHLRLFDARFCAGTIVVNGDTWIDQPLPEDDGPWILAHWDVDAGAQRIGFGKIRIIHTPVFMDIGTPDGLRCFEWYAKTHLDAGNQSANLEVEQSNLSSDKENV